MIKIAYKGNTTITMDLTKQQIELLEFMDYNNFTTVNGDLINLKKKSQNSLIKNRREIPYEELKVASFNISNMYTNIQRNKLTNI